MTRSLPLQFQLAAGSGNSEEILAVPKCRLEIEFAVVRERGNRRGAAGRPDCTANEHIKDRVSKRRAIGKTEAYIN